LSRSHILSHSIGCVLWIGYSEMRVRRSFDKWKFMIDAAPDAQLRGAKRTVVRFVTSDGEQAGRYMKKECCYGKEYLSSSTWYPCGLAPHCEHGRVRIRSDRQHGFGVDSSEPIPQVLTVQACLSTCAHSQSLCPVVPLINVSRKSI
jgi:hypothetical protein